MKSTSIILEAYRAYRKGKTDLAKRFMLKAFKSDDFNCFLKRIVALDNADDFELDNLGESKRKNKKLREPVLDDDEYLLSEPENEEDEDEDEDDIESLLSELEDEEEDEDEDDIESLLSELEDEEEDEDKDEDEDEDDIESLLSELEDEEEDEDEDEDDIESLLSELEEEGEEEDKKEDDELESILSEPEDEEEDEEDKSETTPEVTKASIRKIRGIANRIASEDNGIHRDIARRLMKVAKKLESYAS